ncbi:hypothetical protein [Sphingomonas adhaesiva]|uniref:hypothetical protein n=1 Tax=Sphingomonas adhaesiva TaxID=28212 RepID=UPI002FF5E2A2
MLRLGSDTGPAVLAVPALFEEANRTRTLLVMTLRLLADRGIAGALPDLPGQNDSLLPTIDARLSAWRGALAAAARCLPGPVHVVAIRGGALLDAAVDAASRWYLAPLSGEAQVRELDRLRRAGGGQDYAGNDLHPDLLTALAAAEPITAGPLRVVRMEGDPRPADRILAAAPPWRASEPRADPALAAMLADDIAGWIE